MNSKKSLVEKPKAKATTKKVLVEKPKAKATTKKVSVEKPKAKPKATKKGLVEKPKAKAKPKATKKVSVEKPNAKPKAKATKKVLVEKPKAKATKKGGGPKILDFVQKIFKSSTPLSKVINEFVTNSNSLYEAYDQLLIFLDNIEEENYKHINEEEKKIILKLLNYNLNENFNYENITNTEYMKILNSSTFKSIIPYINLIELSNKIYKSIKAILELDLTEDKVSLSLVLDTYKNNDKNKEDRDKKISKIKKLLTQNPDTHLQSDNTIVQKQDTMTTITNFHGFDPSGTSGTSISAQAPLPHSLSSETKITEEANQLLGIK